jgi:peroxiredoxin family protein
VRDLTTIRTIENYFAHSHHCAKFQKVSDTICIFFHRGDYDAMHQGLSIAAAAVSTGKKTELYFFWWALERLAKDRLDEPDLARDDVNTTMELRNIPTLRQLLNVVRDSGLAQVFACSGSLSSIGLNPGDVESKVDSLIGWTSILQRTNGNPNRFFL